MEVYGCYFTGGVVQLSRFVSLEGSVTFMGKVCLSNNKLVRRFIPPFNMDFPSLNRALAEGNENKTNECFQVFDNVNLNKNQKESVYTRGFEYYVSVKNRFLTDRYYALIVELGDEALTKDINRYYDTYVLNGSRFLEKTLDEMASVSDNQKGPYYALVAAMYRNKGDKEKTHEFEGRMRNAVDAQRLTNSV